MYLGYMRKDKPRDIARGVLPSTARKSARENKRNYHAKHRGAQRLTNISILRSMNALDDDGHIYTDADLFDDFEESLVYDGYHAKTKDPSLGWDDMNAIVESRRSGDKLGPLIRWARAIHDREMSGPEWTDSDKIAYFKAVLPDTLQGRHALGHVKQYLGLSNDPFYYGYLHTYTKDTKEKFRACLDNILSTPKGRRKFYDFRLETIPSAAHTADSANKVQTLVHAVNENGEGLYVDSYGELNGARPMGEFPRPVHHRLRPYRKMALVPQPIAATCDTCSFLRNEALYDPAAINEFANIIWDSVSHPRFRYSQRRSNDPSHGYMLKIYNYIMGRDTDG